ncbi:MAG TPA: glycosyltransferase [Bryobacteraceae bacterium]|nr:glycosyltransferase [Bryobacteraceae bacterium]
MTTTSARKHGDSAQIAAISVAVLIPAYQPGPALIEVVRPLAEWGFTAIVVVDDGSGREYAGIFEQVQRFDRVRIIRHAVNLGKGAALKTGMNYALVEYPELAGIVTADADGQHDPDDVCGVARRFAEKPEALVLGARKFTGYVPLRSRAGNWITRSILRVAVGHRLSDTQTGLRAVPRVLVEKMLSVPASGYEFELEMLIAAKHLGVEVIEQPIQTIYGEGNPTSHFEPLRDSMRIYFVLLRFGFISMVTAGLDNVAFYVLFRASGVVGTSLFGARALALAFNYTAVRKAVFFSKEQHRIVLPRYLLLAAANICLSYALISFLTGVASFRVMPAKISVETFLFIANFTIQRDFVFANRSGGPKTKP